MRVAYFTESLFPHVDGVSRTLAQLFTSLLHHGIEFRVYSPFVPGSEVPWAERVRRVPYFNFPLHPDYRVSLPYGHGALDDAEQFAPDLVHVVSPTLMAARAQKWAQARRIPVVSSYHTHFVSYGRFYRMGWLEGFGWWMNRRFYSRCERVYPPSYSIIRELAEHGITNTELWSRGIDLDRFSPRFRDPELRRLAGAEGDTPLVLMVSRLVKEKDLADLVEMQRLLRARGTRHRLVLVGDGPMRAELERDLPDAYFAGHQEGESLARWYASGDVFVFPSTTETFANVVLEAEASGVPPVVVDRGGPPDLVEQGVTGFIARPNDPEDLAGYVERLLQDAALRTRMGAAAHAAAQGRDWPTINGALIDSYARVIEEYRTRKGTAG
jgi:phosphatidylinositol alpha 1,6-mannosyltransferase